MSTSIQKKAVRGTIWSGAGSLALQLVTFSVGIVMARLLSPQDYGLIGMLGIFTAIAGCLIDSGMGSALVRKENRTEVDFCTVFYFSSAVALALYISLFFIAPWIAEFYNQPELCSLTRVICITLVLGSICGVYNAKLYINLDFKTPAIVNVSCALFSGAVGVGTAYSGFGVWALVCMQLSSSILRLVLLLSFIRWIPRAQFSKESFHSMFGFGSKLLGSTLIATAYDNIRPLIIGKLYSGAELGYYIRANHYANLPTMTVHGMFSGVAYPLLCKYQGNIGNLQNKWRLLVRLSCFVLFPVAIGIAAIAKPFIVFFITDKWLPAVPFTQLLCFALILYPVHGLNLDILRVVGRSDAILKAEVYKKIIGIVILIATVPFGVLAMCWGSIITSVACFFINSHYTAHYIDVTRWQQFLDILPIFLLASSMGAVVWSLVTFLPLSPALQLAIGIPAGIVLYIGLAWLFRMSELTDAWQLIRNNLRKSSQA